MRKPVQKTHSFMLDMTDHKLLQALSFYRYLRADQLTRLFFSPGSLTWVKSTLLKRLVDHGYIQTITGEGGKPIKPFVYTLHNKGKRYLTTLGMDVQVRSPEQIHTSLLFLAHTLAVNDVLIAAALLDRAVPEVTLAQVQHELVLKRHPLHVTYLDAQRGTVTEVTQTLLPDAWLDLYITCEKEQTQWRVSIWLELDRGTVEAKKCKRKVRAVMEYLKSGSYQQQFDTPAASIAFATTAGERRVEKIRQWIEEEARNTGDEDMLAIFFTTALPDTRTLDPQTLFFSPVWFKPFRESLPVPLLPSCQ